MAFMLTGENQLIQDHLKEMFSIIYTPTEGDAIQNFSRLFRRPVGCFLNIEDQERVHEDLARWGQPEDIDYIVVTDGEEVSLSFHYCQDGETDASHRFSALVIRVTSTGLFYPSMLTE